MDDQNRKLAGLILNCKPREIKAISTRADGSLAVVAPNGMKFIFSPVELENARDSFGLPAVPSNTGKPLASTGSANETHLAASIPAQQKSLHGTDASSTASTSSATGRTQTTGTSMAEPACTTQGLPCVCVEAPMAEPVEAPMAEPVEAHGVRP